MAKTDNKGKIIKGIAGFYYVDTGGSGIYACKARGIFRKDGEKPLVGDDVLFGITDEKDMEGSIREILPRKNAMQRPLCANIDQALIVFSLKRPALSQLLLDKMLVQMEISGIPAVLALSKSDTADADEVDKLRNVYEGCGYPFLVFSSVSGEGTEALKRILAGKTTALSGASGVGKSTLANFLMEKEAMETGALSRKNARGKNTTRHAELFAIRGGGYVMDTPGFSSFDPEKVEKESLRFYFPEFAPYEGKCRFQGCLHRKEPGCAVKDAIAEGAVDAVRHENYLTMLAEYEEYERRRY